MPSARSRLHLPKAAAGCTQSKAPVARQWMDSKQVLRKNQIRFGFVGKEISDVSGSGKQDRGGFLDATVSDVEVDHFGRMSHCYAALVKVFVLAHDCVAV